MLLSIKQHLLHPLSYSIQKDGQFQECPILTKKQKVKLIALSILIGIPTFAIGGVVVFYSLSAQYKIKKLKHSNNVTETKIEALSPFKTSQIPEKKPISPQTLMANLWGVRVDDPQNKPTQLELNALIKGGVCPFTFHEKQKVGYGYCGQHAINNAFGEEVEDESFAQKVSDILEKRLGCKLPDDRHDFGVDPALLTEILQEGKKKCETKSVKLSDLPGFSENKEQAITDYLGKAEWFLAYHSEKEAHPMPSKGHATYPIATGHVIAARKDAEGQWWIIDSRNPFMLDIPLTLFHKNFYLIVPIEL